MAVIPGDMGWDGHAGDKLNMSSLQKIPVVREKASVSSRRETCPSQISQSHSLVWKHTLHITIHAETDKRPSKQTDCEPQVHHVKEECFFPPPQG
jgi:hypothetical protein